MTTWLSVYFQRYLQNQNESVRMQSFYESVFPHIQTEYRDLQGKADFGYFLRSD